MNILILIISSLMIVAGIFFILKSNSMREFYKKVKEGNVSQYKKIVGTVICDAYSLGNREVMISRRPVTPIVEYKVNGQTYEAMNRVLETGAELPVGTKMYVWYKKDNPKQAIIGTELESASFEKLGGVFLITIGIMFLLAII